jgi:hypothetical protein
MELLNRWRVGCGVVWAMWRGEQEGMTGRIAA